MLILSMRDSLTKFSLLPVPLFILMGEVMFRSGVALRMLNSLDKWIGRVAGRLSLLAVAAGTLFACMTGSSMASVATLGELLVPEMEKHGYKKTMTLGPILGSGGLAMMIPPSAMAIILGCIAEVSIAKLLLAIIMPGLLLAILSAAYIIIRCRLQPHLAPSYKAPPSALSDKLIDTVRYILPLGVVIFLVIGVMIMGVATPSEAAASGTIGAFILAVAYGGLDWKMVKKSFLSTIEITSMLFCIIMASLTFGQILAFCGATRGLIELSLGLPVPPIGIIIGTQVVLLILGMFVNPIAIMMICIPVFMPILTTLGFDPIWFLAIFLVNVELGALTPPFGMLLFVMQGVAPNTTFDDCVRAAFPFMIIDAVAIGIIIAVPSIALWLPGLIS